jgi:hypothetical protein
MTDNPKTIQMAIVDPGIVATNGEFTFEMQPRYNPTRTVKYTLTPKDAMLLRDAAIAFIDAVTKK